MVFVVKDLEQNLLGIPAIEELNLLAKVAEVRQEPDDLGDITNQFPALFLGLGTLPVEFQIHLKPDATPLALHTPRNVPLSLCKKVKEELSRMESLEVISRVDVPTPGVLEWLLFPKRMAWSRFVLICTPQHYSPSGNSPSPQS